MLFNDYYRNRDLLGEYVHPERTADKLKMQVADYITDYLKSFYECGISKKQVCKFFNISKSKLTLWCSGKYDFTCLELAQISEKLRIVPTFRFITRDMEQNNKYL